MFKISNRKTVPIRGVWTKRETVFAAELRWGAASLCSFTVTVPPISDTDKISKSFCKIYNTNFHICTDKNHVM